MSRDAVGVAEQLRGEVAERVRQILELGAGAPAEIYVGWVAALEAAVCPARYRAQGEEGWGFPGWSPTLAGGGVGRAALARWLEVDATRRPDPLGAVREWMRETARTPVGSVAEWIADLVRAGDRATLAATAATASRWMAGFVRVLGWPLPDRLALVSDGSGPVCLRWPRRWRAGRDGPVRVASAPDGVIGRLTPSGRFELVIHRPTSAGEGRLADRAAFEATAGALSCGIVAEQVLVVTADTGERNRFPVGSELLARGADLITAVVRQQVAARQEWTYDDATPSAACHHCPVQPECLAGQAWLTGPAGRWRSGLPTLRT